MRNVPLSFSKLPVRESGQDTKLAEFGVKKLKSRISAKANSTVGLSAVLAEGTYHSRGGSEDSPLRKYGSHPHGRPFRIYPTMNALKRSSPSFSVSMPAANESRT